MPKVGDFFESYRASEFVLVVDGTESPGVSKISGLSEGEIETIEQPDGGSWHVYKVAGSKVKFEPLTIERYVDGSPEDQRFRDWFQTTFKLNRPTQGGSGVRKDGLIIKRHNGEDVITFAFYGAWVKSSKFTDLEAGTTNLFKQTLVVEVEGMERVTP
jgi:phage tail-like protein